MNTRPKGVMVYSSPTNPIAEDAKRRQRQKQEEADRLSAERRQVRYDTAPNTVCYADTAFKDWQPGIPIPKCRKCRGRLHPTEHHQCPGYIPRYRDLDTDTRRMMREAKMDNEGDWDDDQYDPTTPGEVIRDPDCEDSGTVFEGRTEEEDLMRRFGYLPNWDEL